VYDLYVNRDATSRKWISVFEKLPIGLLVLNQDKIMHFNEQMTKICGH